MQVGVWVVVSAWERGDGTQLVGEGDTMSLVMQVEHKCACIGEGLTGHTSGRVWVFGFLIGL